jgi:3',5'-cyclic AMP phosphodiesterase CpdA
MPHCTYPDIAVVADAHFHDLFGDYDFAGTDDPRGAMRVRPLADTARSTRVFNESYFALRHTLDDIAKRKIHHVVLLGDYSDDGQRTTVATVARLLRDYSKRHGMQFYATVGNHDIFGPAGRHRSKRFLNGTGGHTLVTSNPDMQDPQADRVIVSEKMFCDGYPAGLLPLADVGFCHQPGYLHWETPFGTDDDPATRTYPVCSDDGKIVRRLMDCSYLVEPFAGVWLLMIDANVFVPDEAAEGGFRDSTAAGWNAMLKHKRFVIDWIADVATRAKAGGKQLLAFSHYPALDPLDGTVDDERAVLGDTSLSLRIPEPDVAAALVEAGLNLHFSGHLHVNDTARFRNTEKFLVNIGVPSLVAFPAGYKIVRVGHDTLGIETVSIDAMSLDAGIVAQYQNEIAATGQTHGGMLTATTYGAFLDAHIGHLIGRRHLRREWPKDLAALMQVLSCEELAVLALLPEIDDSHAALAAMRTGKADPVMFARLAALALAAGLAPDRLATIPAMRWLQDWYRLRMGSELALGYIPNDHLAAYRWLETLFAGKEEGTSVRARFARLLRMQRQYRSGLPSADFSIDLAIGEIIGR